MFSTNDPKDQTEQLMHDIARHRQARFPAARTVCAAALHLACPVVAIACVLMVLLSGGPLAAASGTGAQPRQAGPSPQQASAVAALLSSSDKTAVREFRVRRGDTLARILRRASIDRTQAHDAAVAFGKVFDLRTLRLGEVIRITLSGDRHLREIRIDRGPEEYVLTRGDQAGVSFAAVRTEKALTKELVLAGGRIRTSLYVSAKRAKVPYNVLAQMIRLYSWSVDFQREIQPGDTFEIAYERFLDLAGNVLVDGEIVYAQMVLSGDDMPLFRFETKPGRVEYFDDKGRGARRTLMRTPIDGARLSSGYGKRQHPILGFTRMHRGVDFAAPRGTPIYAAGDGVVRFRGWKGGYGRYIQIRHNSTYSTAYGHLSRFRRGVTRGSRVRQGQVIGYVGSSGLSTGPHLHYEVLVNNRKVNPLSLTLSTGTRLKGPALVRFHAERRRIAREAASLRLLDTAGLL